MDESDAELIARSLNGEPDAFSEVFWRHNGAVHAYFVRRAGRNVADDLVADVWLRAYRGREHFRLDSPDARPWLYGVARHVLLRHWRSRHAIPPLPSSVVHDPWPDLDAAMDRAGRRQELTEAIAKLSESEREVIMLSVWEQLRAVDIALVLSLPASTVRNRLHRARQILRAHVAFETSTDQRDRNDQP